MSTVLVVYHTFTGKTKKMAEAVAEGIQSVQGAYPRIGEANDTGPEDFANADAVAFGAPNTFGGMAGAFKDFFDRGWAIHEKMKGKPAVAFTCEKPDESGALKQIETFFTFFGLNKVAEGIAAPGEIGEKEIERCRELGRKLGEAAAGKYALNK